MSISSHLLSVIAAMSAGLLPGSAADKHPAEGDGQQDFPIVELRQYTLHDGQRDNLITLFEREFVETQEAVGMSVIGTFVDLDRPNRFVWVRGFRDMVSRAESLTSFYGGPVWEAHRDAANATMIDSDNVLLLRAPNAAAELKPGPLTDASGRADPNAVVIATIAYLKSDLGAAERVFDMQIRKQLDLAGIPLLGWYATENKPNNFPRLPVREKDKVLVWFTAFNSMEQYLSRSAQMTEAAQQLEPFLAQPSEVLRLQPTSRSRLPDWSDPARWAASPERSGT